MLSRYNFIKLNRIFSVNVPIGGHYSATRSASQLNKSKIQDIEDFAKVFQSTSEDAIKHLASNHLLTPADKENVVRSTKLLKELNFTFNDVKLRPRILGVNEITLQNRYEVLKECEFTNIGITNLYHYTALMNVTVEQLKLHKRIPQDIDMQDHLLGLLKQFNLSKSSLKLNEKAPLKAIRKEIIELFFEKAYQLKEEDVRRIVRIYTRHLHKSFRSMIDLHYYLTKEIGFDSERINKNGFLLHADPINIKNLLEKIPQIGGMDIRELMCRRPKIIMNPYESIEKTIKCIKNFGISEEVIIKCNEILTLSPNTIQSRLEELQKIKEFDVLKDHPRVLRLVHYQPKAVERLEELKRMNVKCVSLHILCTNLKCFQKYAKEGMDKTKGCDTIAMLSVDLNRSAEEIRGLLSRHQHWCHVPVASVKETLSFLLENSFTSDDINANIHIVLYPREFIEEKLNHLKSTNHLKNFQFNYEQLSKLKILNLCLYLIEQRVHFSGDGIWPESIMNQSELPYPVGNIDTVTKEINHGFSSFNDPLDSDVDVDTVNKEISF